MHQQEGLCLKVAGYILAPATFLLQKSFLFNPFPEFPAVNGKAVIIPCQFSRPERDSRSMELLSSGEYLPSAQCDMRASLIPMAEWIPEINSGVPSSIRGKSELLPNHEPASRIFIESISSFHRPAIFTEKESLSFMPTVRFIFKRQP